MITNSHILKLTGKSELPEAVEIGSNYNIALSGSITAVAEHDNNDGTADKIYTFKPIKLELLTPKGKTLVLKDTRSNSQLLRSMLNGKWKNAASSISFEDAYSKFVHGVMGDMDELVDRYGIF
jgi:anthranilate phosphoribosyltransferase